jgi:ribosome-associated toxin RatA of RatAB toxin-antitoxin module
VASLSWQVRALHLGFFIKQQMHIFARRLPSLSIPSGGATNRFRQCRRTFLNLPGNPFASLAGAASPEPLRYHEEKPLPFSQRQLYSLIADIDSYSEFVPYCTSSSVRSARSLPDGARLSLRDRSWLVGGKEGEEYQLEGELKVGFQGLDQAYTSKVTCKKWESVKVGTFQGGYPRQWWCS